MKFIPLSLFLGLGLAVVAGGPSTAAAAAAAYSPATLPGKGLAQHDFFYSGEAKAELLSIVRDGGVIWSWTYPGRGEISDAILEPNGHILFAHQFGITEVTLDKQTVWNFDAPAGTEIHTAQPYGTNSVLFIQNDNPAKLIVINKTSGQIEHQFTLPVKFPDSVHRQFRRVRVAADGNLLVAHLDLGKVVEYDWTGKALWSEEITNAFSLQELTNGNILTATSGAQFVREFNQQGQTVWEWHAADAPEYKFSNTQTATRLANGDTLINNWYSQSLDKLDTNHLPVQAIEVTPDKKVVWALRSWAAPAALGPSTTIQPLDDYMAPADLPGNGMAQHDFLLTGEWDHRKKDQTIYVIRHDQVDWTYSISINDTNGVLQELGDATMLSNGNIVFCRKVGASEITPDKKIIWNIEAPKGTEIHSIQPVGLDHVLVTENGNPARVLLINTTSGQTEKQLTLPVGQPEKPHMQFRRVHLTKDGTYLAAQIADNKVVEYDADGKAIWTYKTFQPWSAARLKNDNTLITAGPHTVVEVNKAGQIVWQFSQADAPLYKFFIFQEASRLANGNTVICNWCPYNLKDPARWPGSVQVLEVTPDKKVVWVLNQWQNPDLGPASSIQLLDEPGVAENGDL
jgi:WD40 repeat protein